MFEFNWIASAVLMLLWCFVGPMLEGNNFMWSKEIEDTWKRWATISEHLYQKHDFKNMFKKPKSSTGKGPLEMMWNTSGTGYELLKNFITSESRATTSLQVARGNPLGQGLHVTSFSIFKCSFEKVLNDIFQALWKGNVEEKSKLYSRYSFLWTMPAKLHRSPSLDGNTTSALADVQ